MNASSPTPSHPDIREAIAAAIYGEDYKLKRGTIAESKPEIDRILALFTHQLDSLKDKGVFVTYKADNGHGIAIPVSAVEQMKEQMR